MKNWKTTLGGMVTALATLTSSNNQTLHTIGIVCSIIGPIIIGMSARDANVTVVDGKQVKIKDLTEEQIANN